MPAERLTLDPNKGLASRTSILFLSVTFYNNVGILLCWCLYVIYQVPLLNTDHIDRI